MNNILSTNAIFESWKIHSLSLIHLPVLPSPLTYKLTHELIRSLMQMSPTRPPPTKRPPWTFQNVTFWSTCQALPSNAKIFGKQVIISKTNIMCEIIGKYFALLPWCLKWVIEYVAQISEWVKDKIVAFRICCTLFSAKL